MVHGSVFDHTQNDAIVVRMVKWYVTIYKMHQMAQSANFRSHPSSKSFSMCSFSIDSMRSNQFIEDNEFVKTVGLLIQNVNSHHISGTNRMN